MPLALAFTRRRVFNAVATGLVLAVVPYFMTRVGEGGARLWLAKRHPFDVAALYRARYRGPTFVACVRQVFTQAGQGESGAPGRAPGREPVTVSIKCANIISILLFCISLVLLLTLRFLILRKGFI